VVEKIENIYKIKRSTQVSEPTTVSEKVKEGTQLWHERLGDMSEKGCQVLMNHKLLPDLKSFRLDLCKRYVYGKKCKQKFKTRSHNSKQILDYIHSNLWGPSPTISYGGALYFLTFIDDLSHKFLVYILKRKAVVSNVFK